MAAAVPDEQPSYTCAVLQAWQKSQQVMNRMMQGCLVHLPADSKKIQRAQLGENVDLLGPLICELGPLPQMCIVLCIFFYKCGYIVSIEVSGLP